MLYVLIFFAVQIMIIFKITMHFINDPARSKRDCIFTLFAPPGCGKTTTLALLVAHYTKKKYRIYANFDCKGTIPIKWEHIGKYNFKNSVVLIDEAGIDVNSRKFMELTADKIKYLKTHRHYRCEMWFASQAYDDIDITVRRLSQRYYLVSRTFFNFITKKFYIRCIKKSISIDKNTRQIIDAYDFVPFSKYKFKGRKLFKMFNSFSVDIDLPDFPVTEPPVPIKPPKKKKNRKQDSAPAPADPLTDLFDNVSESPVPKAPEHAEDSASVMSFNYFLSDLIENPELDEAFASTPSVDEPVSDQPVESPQTTNTTFSLDDLF